MTGDHHLWRKSYAYDASARVPMLLQEERAGVSIKVPPADIEAVIKRDG